MNPFDSSGCQTSKEDGFRSTLLVSIAALAEDTRGEIKGQRDG